MRILQVTGGRGYADKEFLYQVLDAYHRRHSVSHLVHGAAPGADTLAANWARERGVQPVACPANWDLFKRRAGYLRNSAMADLLEAIDPVRVVVEVMVFPGGVGTNMMREICDERGIEVIDALDYRR